MRTIIITPPAAYPITLAEAKEFCRIEADNTSEDNTLNLLIASMTNYAEHLTGRAFVERTLEAYPECFEICLHLPFAPLITVDSITYTDIQLTEQTVDPSTYQVDTVSEPGIVRPAWGKFWPIIGYTLNPIRVRYHCGYQAPGSPVDLTDNSYIPGEVRTWMNARICTLYDNRSQFLVERATMLPIPRDFADGLLDSLVLGTRLF